MSERERERERERRLSPSNTFSSSLSLFFLSFLSLKVVSAPALIFDDKGESILLKTLQETFGAEGESGEGGNWFRPLFLHLNFNIYS